MSKKLLFAATMAAMLASCQSDQLSVNSANQQTAAEGYIPYEFEAYTQRALTRAGEPGAIDNAKLAQTGFGVFTYYTDDKMYDETFIPNYMYNEKVYKDGDKWTYGDPKYWPGEYGSKAQSDDVDFTSFFAYAPYVENTPKTGKVADDGVGIAGLTRNTAQGDPYVKYIGSLDPSKCVDLCWGVCAEADHSWDIIQGGTQNLTAGYPWINVQRPSKAVGQKVKFTFKHALSQLNVQIDADVNTDTHGQGAEVDANTKVFVRSVTFSGFTMKGALNLNNVDKDQPNWKGFNCNNEPLQGEEITIYDGMRDGKEGTGYVASNEKVTGLNPTLIQSKKWSEQAATDGVQKTPKNLFGSDVVDSKIFVIPTGDEMQINVEYDIETVDPKLGSTVSDGETNGSTVPNSIRKTITLSDNTTKLILKAGKCYTIKLHLGMSTIDFDAVVEEDWDETQGAAEAWFPTPGSGDQPAPVPATGISLSPTSLNMTAGDAAVPLDVNVEPADATDKSVTWTSDNETVATVNANGEVTPLAAGTATITATNSAGQTATCTVNVAAADPGVALSAATVGMFVAANGKAYESKDAATAAGTSAQAYIAYKSANAGESLAIALTDDVSDTVWSEDSESTTPDWQNNLDRLPITGGYWEWPSFNDFELMLTEFKKLDVSSGILMARHYWSVTPAINDKSGVPSAYALFYSGPGNGAYTSVEESKTVKNPHGYSCVRAVFKF